MNSLFRVFFSSLTVTLCLAQINYPDETNLIIKKAETLKKTEKLFGETKINVKFYAVETDTKWTNLKQDKDGLLMTLIQSTNGSSIKQIRVNNDIITTSIPSINNSENNNKMPLNLKKNGNFYYDFATSEPELEMKKNQDDYFSSQVAIFSWPVTENAVPMCAGSLISNHYVLTTANCVNNEKRVHVVCGARNIQDPESFQFKIDSSSFIIHEKWNELTLKDNIALIKLPEPVELNDHISIVNLPTKVDENKTFIDYDATLVGWSSDREEGVAVATNATDVIISNAKCFFSYRSFILSSHICLSGSRNNSSCVGENGDQLFVKDEDGAAKLVGLLSFGMEDGCQQKQPVVFTRVTSYLTWIESHVELK